MDRNSKEIWLRLNLFFYAQKPSRLKKPKPVIQPRWKGNPFDFLFKKQKIAANSGTNVNYKTNCFCS